MKIANSKHKALHEAIEAMQVNDMLVWKVDKADHPQTLRSTAFARLAKAGSPVKIRVIQYRWTLYIIRVE